MEASFKKLKTQYENLKNGKPKMTAIKIAIDAAEREKDYDWQLTFIEDFISESIFYEDSFEAFVIFPEYISIFDKNEQNLEFYTDYDMLWVYKMILSNVEDFYQISCEKIEQYFEDFKLRCLKYGYSLRAYEYKYRNYIQTIDIDKYKKINNNYLNYKRDRISDCEACELVSEIGFELFYGSFEKAIEKSKIIFEGIKKCESSIPWLYYKFLHYYIDKKDIKNSKKYEKLLYKEIKNNLSWLNSIGLILKLCALENINRGIRLFQKYLNWYIEYKNPSVKFDFEIGAYKLFKSIKEKRTKETIKLLLPKNFIIYKEDGIYNIDDIINHFESNLLDTAGKFDKRNGNTYYFDEIYDNQKDIEKK